MKRRYDFYLQDILDAIGRIRQYTRDCDLEHDDKTVAAVTRELEIIDEAIGQLPAALRKRHPSVPWQQMKDLRNVVVHQYWRVDTKILRTVIKEKLPSFTGQIEDVLEHERSRETD